MRKAPASGLKSPWVSEISPTRRSWIAVNAPNVRARGANAGLVGPNDREPSDSRGVRPPNVREPRRARARATPKIPAPRHIRRAATAQARREPAEAPHRYRRPHLPTPWWGRPPRLRPSSGPTATPYEKLSFHTPY